MVVVEDRSEPKLAVANEVEPDLARVEVSVGVVWKVLVVVGSVCTTAAAAALALAIVGIVCDATALELAAERE